MSHERRPDESTASASDDCPRTKRTGHGGAPTGNERIASGDGTGVGRREDGEGAEGSPAEGAWPILIGLAVGMLMASILLRL